MNRRNWTRQSQRVLFNAIRPIRVILDEYIESLSNTEDWKSNEAVRKLQLDLQTIIHNQTLDPNTSALGKLCHEFKLSKFERQTLLLVAGTELIPGFRSLIAQALGLQELSYPTFDLAIELFDLNRDFEYYSASYKGPLRKWELILFKNSRSSRQFRELEMDEKILDYLLGYSHLDRKLNEFVFPLVNHGYITKNTKSIKDIALGITRVFETAINSGGESPLIQLCGSSLNLKQQIVATALAPLELPIYELHWVMMNTDDSELRQFYTLWTREVMLSDCVLLINCENIGKSDTEQLKLLYKFLTIVDSPIILCTSQRLTLSARYATTLEIPDLEYEEQYELWQMYLGKHAAAVERHLESIVANFQLNPQEIVSTVNSSLATASDYDDLCDKLWATCRNRARPALDELAQRIEPSAGWSDLILPDDRKEILREMIAQVRHRTQVFQKWKFKKKNNRGLGLCALFAGTSGTGKTMAAEVLAMELNLDLYRIDLSTVVSKYIGETEKNLGKLFDAAESGGVILLFDEGDALFGKRTEASDSKDRYANMEVSYLLQRIESYSGLAIVTTNIEDSLDSAFMRRLRYVVKFPFPGPNERAAIWQRVYPEGVLKESNPRIYQMLAQMEISGGLIYSIALKSAFIAADRGVDGVYIDHIHQAAKSEYSKIGRVLSVSETPWIRSV